VSTVIRKVLSLGGEPDKNMWTWEMGVMEKDLNEFVEKYQETIRPPLPMTPGHVVTKDDACQLLAQVGMKAINEYVEKFKEAESDE